MTITIERYNMNEELRNPQVINGEMFPRNHYLGLESVRKLHQLVSHLKSHGVDVMSIPIINEVEAGLLSEDFEKGTVLGVATSNSENGLDLAQILVWNGDCVIGVSLLMYLHKAANGWKVVGEEGYEKPNFGHGEEKPSAPRPEHTTHQSKKTKSSAVNSKKRNHKSEGKKVKPRQSYY